MPKKLSDIQRVLIANAAQRPSLRLLPPPKSLTKNAGTITTCIKSMLGAGLIETTPADPADTIWPVAGSDHHLTLIVSEAGLAAIESDPADDGGNIQGSAKEDAIQKVPHNVVSTTLRQGTKLTRLIGMLASNEGATLTEIAAAIEWQHHSIRGAISGALKKKLGLIVTSDVVKERGRVYRIEVPTVGNTTNGDEGRSHTSEVVQGAQR